MTWYISNDPWDAAFSGECFSSTSSSRSVFLSMRQEKGRKSVYREMQNSFIMKLNNYHGWVENHETIRKCICRRQQSDCRHVKEMTRSGNFTIEKSAHIFRRSQALECRCGIRHISVRLNTETQNRTEPMKRREENVNINARDSIEMGINIRESP